MSPRERAATPGDLRAAILWDVPALRRSQRVGATAFLNTLHFGFRERTEEFTDPLLVAADALSGELRGDRMQAQAVYRELANVAGRTKTATYTRLLGLALLAWSAPDDVADVIESARANASRIDDEVFRSLYLAKLSGFATDAGLRPQALDLIDEALHCAPKSRPVLVWCLQLSAAAARDQIFLSSRPQGAEPFADFPWIVGTANAALAKAAVNAAEAIAANPWARSWSFGLTDADQLLSAEAQASWSGALWLLQALRLDAAAVVLAQGGRTASEWMYAAAFWILGGGRRLPAVLDFVEAHFDADSFDLLIDEQLRGGARLRDLNRYVEVLYAFWDLLSEERAVHVLHQIQPLTGIDPNARTATALWSVLGALVPEQWGTLYTSLATEQQQAVAETIGPGVVRRLPQNVNEILAKRCEERVASISKEDAVGGEGIWETIVALAQLDSGISDARRERLRALLAKAPPLTRLRVVAWEPGLAERINAEGAIVAVRLQIERAAAGARGGVIARSGVSPISRLAGALGVIAKSRETNEAAKSLVELALDVRIAAPMREDSLQGLSYLARQWVDPGPLASLRQREFLVPNDPFDSDSAQFLEGLWFSIVCLVAPEQGDPPRLFGISRSNDARLREVVARAAGELMRRGQPDEYAPLIAGILYDPAPSVVAAGLQALAVQTGVPALLVDVLPDRLVELFSQGTRAVRQLVCSTAIRLVDESAPPDPRMRRLVDLCASDRSWEVRTAAANRT